MLNTNDRLADESMMLEYYYTLRQRYSRHNTHEGYHAHDRFDFCCPCCWKKIHFEEIRPWCISRQHSVNVNLKNGTSDKVIVFHFEIFLSINFVGQTWESACRGADNRE